MSYKDRTWCTHDSCVKHTPCQCSRVLNDNDLRNIITGKWQISFYIDKPECYEAKVGYDEHT